MRFTRGTELHGSTCRTTLSGETLNVTTPAGFKATEILIEQENPTYNMQGLTNTSNFYDFVNIATSTTATSHTNQYINMTSAYYLIGSINNGTNMKDYSSKAFTNVYALDTLYSSTVNNLNKSVELSLFPMVEDLTGYGGYVINLNDIERECNHNHDPDIHPGIPAPVHPEHTCNHRGHNRRNAGYRRHSTVHF
jgi:hypothetical protein